MQPVGAAFPPSRKATAGHRSLGGGGRSRVLRLSKIVLFLAALVPFALLVRGMLAGSLGVNPAETVQLETGRWALKFLLVSLAITPLRRLSGWNVVIQYRRMLGLFAFFYATLHLASYWSFDLGFAVADIPADIVRRPFIALGFAAFLLLLPLALTSTKGWIRRLGKRWTVLHRLVYAAAICAVLHFAWKVKVFTGDAVLYAVVVTLLLGFRVVWYLRQRARVRHAAART
jgi:methionine sulfoxide reductase heme-binding subunit